jgi:hypothetical protein
MQARRPAALADYLEIDSNLLITNDPYRGAAWKKYATCPWGQAMPPRWGWGGCFEGGVFYNHAAPTGAKVGEKISSAARYQSPKKLLVQVIGFVRLAISGVSFWISPRQGDRALQRYLQVRIPRHQRRPGFPPRLQPSLLYRTKT